MKILPQLFTATRCNMQTAPNRYATVRQQNGDTFECTTKKDISFGSSEQENPYSQILQDPDKMKSFGILVASVYEKLHLTDLPNYLSDVFASLVQKANTETNDAPKVTYTINISPYSAEDEQQALDDEVEEYMSLGSLEEAKESEASHSTAKEGSKQTSGQKSKSERQGLILPRGRHKQEIYDLMGVLSQLDDVSNEVYNGLIEMSNPLIVAKDYEAISKLVNDLKQSDKTDKSIKEICEKYTKKEVEQVDVPTSSSDESSGKNETKPGAKKKTQKPYAINYYSGRKGKSKVEVTFNMPENVNKSKNIKFLEGLTTDFACKMQINDVNRFVETVAKYVVTNDEETVANVKKILDKAWKENYKNATSISSDDVNLLLVAVAQKRQQSDVSSNGATQSPRKPKTSANSDKRLLLMDKIGQIRANIETYPSEYQQTLSKYLQNISNIGNLELATNVNAILEQTKGNSAEAEKQLKTMQEAALDAVNIQDEISQKVAGMKNNSRKALFLDASPVSVSISDKLQLNSKRILDYVDEEIDKVTNNYHEMPYKYINRGNAPVVADLIKYLPDKYKNLYSFHAIMRLIDRFAVSDLSQISYTNIYNNLPKDLDEKLDCLDKLIKYAMLTDSLKGYEHYFVHEIDGNYKSKGLKVSIKPEQIADETFAAFVKKNLGDVPVTVCINRNGDGGYTIGTVMYKDV